MLDSDDENDFDNIKTQFENNINSDIVCSPYAMKSFKIQQQSHSYDESILNCALQNDADLDSLISKVS